MKKTAMITVAVAMMFLAGCAGNQAQVFQDKLFAWDDKNVETARVYAKQILLHWDYNYKVIEEFLGGKLTTDDYVSLKRYMDKIKKQIPNRDHLTEEQVAIVNVSFGKFLIAGGEKLISDGLPQFMKFVGEFRKFFGI